MDFNYFDDFCVANAIRRMIFKGSSFEYDPETNSVEFIRKGSFIFQRNDAPPIVLHGPCLFWMKKGNRYRITGSETEINYSEHLYIDFTGSRSERIVNSLDQISPEGFFNLKNTEAVTMIFIDIIKSYRSNDCTSKAKIAINLEKLMEIVLNEILPKDDSENDIYGLNKLASLIRSDPFQEYDFKKIAKEKCLTYDHLRKLFRKKYEMGLWHYQNHQKMIRAEELLLKSDLRIKEIAFSCGFQTTSDFTRAFTKHFGLSPKAYCVQIKNKANEFLLSPET